MWQASGINRSVVEGSLTAPTSGDSAEANPNRRLLLIIDQLEDVFRRCRSEDERHAFLALLAGLVRTGSERVAIVLALRSDYSTPLRKFPLGEINEKPPVLFMRLTPTSYTVSDRDRPFSLGCFGIRKACLIPWSPISARRLAHRRWSRCCCTNSRKTPRRRNNPA